MKHWSPEEKEIINTILSKFDGSPSRAYEVHPDWKNKLLANHNEGSLYATIYRLKKKAGPEAVKPAAPMGRKLIVVSDDKLRRVTCPHCAHEFAVLEQEV